MCYGKEAMNLVDTGMQRTLTEQVSPKTSDAPGKRLTRAEPLGRLVFIKGLNLPTY